MIDNASGRAGSAFDAAVAPVRAGADPFGQARNLYGQLTETERLGLLDGDAPFWAGLAAMRAVRYGSRPYVHGEVARLGIPGIRFVDGPRGCVAGDGPVAGSPVLPLDPAATAHVAVIGALATAENMGDFGSSSVHPPGHVTPLQGIRAAFPGSDIAHVDGWHVVQVYGSRTEGERAGESALAGFAAAAVPAGGSAEVEVTCSLAPLAIWNPHTRQLDPPAGTTIAFEVAAHAHDPAAVALQVALP